MELEEYVAYQRREYCKDIKCPVQMIMDTYEDNVDLYNSLRVICQHDCIHTTYEFHHWLIDRGYCLIREKDS